MSNVIAPTDFDQFPLRKYKAFEDLRSRLLPEIDLEKVFGSYWDTKLDHHFSRADRRMLEAVSKDEAVPIWHAIQFGPAAQKLNVVTHMHSARSMSEAIASLAEDCCNTGVWPDTVRTLDQPPGGIELRVGDTLLARILPVSATPIQPPDRRQRAKGTLKTLRKSDSPTQELVARLRRWPAMGELRLHGKFATTKAETWHLPEPSEWLLSAQNLCTAAGWNDPSMLDLQTIVCKVFDQESWNHLCAVYEARAEYFRSRTGALWSVYVNQNGEDFAENASWCYLDVYDAMCHWSNLGAAFSKAHPEVELDVIDTYHGGLDGLALFELVSVTQGMASLEFYDQPRISMSPCAEVDVNPVWLARAKAATANQLHDGVIELFQLNRKEDQRHNFRVAELDGQFLFREGQWYFYTDHGERIEKHLFACLVGPDGNLVGSAGVPSYKGRLTWDSQTAGYVLTSDNDEKHPVAIIKGISTKSADILRQHLDHGPGRPFPINREDKDFKDLVDRLTPHGAIRTFG